MQPTRELAKDIFAFIRGRLGPYKRVRRIEFSSLPKTISGKIRRVQLRTVEQESASSLDAAKTNTGRRIFRS